MKSNRINKRFNQLIWAFVSLFLSLIVGVVGYVVIEGYSFLEAFYMTSMIISTVGFGEVRELTNEGKVFSSIYFLLNISLFAYVIAVLSKYLYEGELKDIFTKYMLGREVKKLVDHVIICGLGRNGYRAAMELKSENVPFVVIDAEEEVINNAFGEGHQENYLIGDATEESVLRAAGIERAKVIMACIPRDSTNVFVTLTAREINPKIKIIARAINNSAESKLKTAGADFVVNPDEIGGNYMATLVQRPEVIEFLSLLSGEGEIKLQLEEFSYDQLKEEYRGKSIAEMDVRTISSVTIVSHKTNDKGYVFNPNSKTIMKETEYFIILGTPSDVDRFREQFLKMF